LLVPGLGTRWQCHGRRKQCDEELTFHHNLSWTSGCREGVSFTPVAK